MFEDEIVLMLIKPYEYTFENTELHTFKEWVYSI